ncbi:MAG: 4-demethylwyosine synthase TYW1 [Candidatus Heimdallarchaeota archaeon]|nr:4-demethylwyosine synthase TYW1 [Candidatus Heimdallarchaeota archaeon]
MDERIIVTRINLPESIIYPEIRTRLTKQGYQLYGKQVAVKKCLWTHNYLREGRYCYKSAYGIQSHRCIQATPTLICTHQCSFCWRLQERDLGLKPLWQADPSDFDSPKEVYKGLLYGWKRILSGYKPNTPKEKYEEAMDPKHVALSLAGEPTLYPFMLELLELLHSKNFTTFLVSNGTNPELFEKMTETGIHPTQLYITLPAPKKKLYIKTCRPLIPDGWEKIHRSLKIISNMSGRTVTRLTMAKNINMLAPKEYVDMIKTATPSFIEIKGFVPVGFSQYRVTRENMPMIKDIREFTKQLLQELPNYQQVFEMEESKVIILSNNSQPLKIPGSII